jgi:hypothetical protein
MFQTLWYELGENAAHTGDIATRPIEAGDKASMDGIATTNKDNWNRGGRLCVPKLSSRLNR